MDNEARRRSRIRTTIRLAQDDLDRLDMIALGLRSSRSHACRVAIQSCALEAFGLPAHEREEKIMQLLRK
jgi:predicted transcriptional regulator